ncbi:MAG: type IV pilus twitching motility protein PilT [Candidatus Eisenbacteria bacterium]
MSSPEDTPRDFLPVLSNMIAMGASDLHIKVGAPPTLRIDGVLYPIDEPKCMPAEVDTLIEQLLPPDRRLAFAEEMECDIAVSVPGLARFRVNLCRQRGTVGVSFRLVPTTIPTLAELGMPALLGEIAQEQRGLILVTGATGAGKSTTMAAMVDHLNHLETRKIVTVEDPIEYLHRDDRCLIYQREVGEDTLSFHHGLRHVLRQDPDLILIGEIRDKETLTIALTAANTGHLVITTLHTMDAVQSIQRMLSYYAPHEQDEIRRVLSGNLRTVISQRLVPRAMGQGRIAAVEILVNTPTIRDLILDPTKTSQIRQAITDGVSQYGMQSFDQALANLVRQQVITPQDAVRFATYPNELKLHLSGINDASNRAWASVEMGALDQKEAGGGSGVPAWMDRTGT